MVLAAIERFLSRQYTILYIIIYKIIVIDIAPRMFQKVSLLLYGTKQILFISNNIKTGILAIASVCILDTASEGTVTKNSSCGLGKQSMCHLYLFTH